MQNIKGAKLATPGPAGTQHEGIGCYDPQGNPWVIENSKLHGKVVCRPILAGENWQIIESASQGFEDVMVHRALALQNKPYHVTAYNCQHFASEVYTGEATSWQLGQIASVLGVAALAVYLNQSPAKKRTSKKTGK
jgi:hypothetical protein